MPDLERIVRPIVEGQIRGFLKEHPVVVAAVDWYKPRKSKEDTFVNSLAKRIVRDLVCPMNRARLAAALVEGELAAPSNSSVELRAADEGGQSGNRPGLAANALAGARATPAGGVGLDLWTGPMPESVHGIVACDGWCPSGIPAGWATPRINQEG